jgi:H+/Cl- antiporter ClcA
LPAGDFMCLFLVGAALGRLFGHGFQAIFPGRGEGRGRGREGGRRKHCHTSV